VPPAGSKGARMDEEQQKRDDHLQLKVSQRTNSTERNPAWLGLRDGKPITGGALHCMQYMEM